MINPSRFGRAPNPWDSLQESQLKKTMAAMRFKQLAIDGTIMVLAVAALCSLAYVCWGP